VIASDILELKENLMRVCQSFIFEREISNCKEKKDASKASSPEMGVKGKQV
jgi:hypothetical protein